MKNMISAFVAIRRGRSKAKRDIALIKKFLREPWRWACPHDNNIGPWCPDDPFWNALGADLPKDEPYERTAYWQLCEVLFRDIAPKATPAVSPPGATTFSNGVKFVTIETDGSESTEDIAGKIARAVAEQDAFSSIIRDAMGGDDKP